jgi:predicted metalloprotease with PDZ domain
MCRRALWMMWCVVWLAGCQPHPLQQRSLLGGEELVGEPGEARSASSTRPSLAAAPPAELRRGALWYSITARGDRLEVAARLLKPAARTSFFLPGAWAGRDDYADHIRIVGAWGEGGSRALTLEREQGRLDVEAEAGDGWIELRYEVRLYARTSAAQRFLPQRLGDGFFVYAPTMLILPSERVAQTLRDIPVEVRASSSGLAVSTWPLVREAASVQDATQRVYGFVASDIHHLRDAYLAVTDAVVEQPGAGARVVFERGYRGDRAKLADTIRRVLALYQARYGALGEQVVTALVRSPGERGLTWGTGRRGGFVLELDAEARVGHETALLVTHEAFHMWNGHLLIPRSEEEAQTRWFKEGLTHYIALGALGELGLSSEREVLGELAQAARRYKHSPMTRLGEGAGTPEQRALYPYDRGLLLALALDEALRRGSLDTCTLDTWFAQVLARSRQRGGYYDAALLGQALRELPCDTGAAQRVWQAHVVGSEALELDGLFGELGLHWLDAEGGRPAKLIPLDGQPARYARMLAMRRE